MRLPAALEFLRATHPWQVVRDWRYLHRHRARRDFYGRFIRPGGLVFDIGANAGHYARVFLSLGARVVAVEPQAAMADGLRRRFRGQSRLVVVQTALGATRTTATLRKAPDLSEVASLRSDVGERSRFRERFAATATETVAVGILDDLVQAHGQPDFCKIDVEGFEAEVLAGLTQPLPLLSFEVNREYLDVAGACLQRLVSLGRYEFNFARGDLPGFFVPGWVPADDLLAHLRDDPDPLLWGDIYARLRDHA
jgi:FkbM family methyltransferase